MLRRDAHPPGLVSTFCTNGEKIAPNQEEKEILPSIPIVAILNHKGKRALIGNIFWVITGLSPSIESPARPQRLHVLSALSQAIVKDSHPSQPKLEQGPRVHA